MEKNKTSWRESVHLKEVNKSVKMRKKQVECESGDNQLEKGYIQKYIKEKEKRKQAEKTRRK